MLVQSIINTSIHSCHHMHQYCVATCNWYTMQGYHYKPKHLLEPSGLGNWINIVIVTCTLMIQVKHYHSINNLWQYGTWRWKFQHTHTASFSKTLGALLAAAVSESLWAIGEWNLPSQTLRHASLNLHGMKTHHQLESTLVVS